jgi:elongation factor P
MPETVNYNEIRRGLNIELDGDAYEIVEFKHVYMQQRAPTLTLKVRQLRSGKVFDRNMPGSQRLTIADVEESEAQYLYHDGEAYIFMDNESFDQYPLTGNQIGDQAKYLKEGENITVVSYKGEPVSVVLANTVELEVTDTAPAFKGDTAQAGRKPATLSTGAQVKIPMHVVVGQTVRVDTRTGEYLAVVS